MDRFNLECEMPASWWEVVKEFMNEEDIQSLNRAVNLRLETEKVVPKMNQICRAFQLTKWDQLKVVILGQDPYPTEGHAHGLAFSTEDFVQPFPRSLRNIFLELQRSIPNYSLPISGNLQSWAEQGVLLLNTQLTTREGEANAHAKIGWQTFTSAVMKAIDQNKNGMIGMFWGKSSEKLSDLWCDKQYKLITSHPSPLSVRRGFEGCGHFALVNQVLRERNQPEINW